MKKAYRYAACVTVAAALFGAAGVAVDTYSASSPVALAASKSRRAKKIRKVNKGISHDLKLGIMTYVKSGGEIVGSSKGLNRYKFKWYN